MCENKAPHAHIGADVYESACIEGVFLEKTEVAVLQEVVHGQILRKTAEAADGNAPSNPLRDALARKKVTHRPYRILANDMRLLNCGNRILQAHAFPPSTALMISGTLLPAQSA